MRSSRAGDAHAPDDLQLAQRCVAGDRAAQVGLFRAHRHRVHAKLFRILGTNAAIDDLLQEVFLNVFRSLRIYRGEAALSTWVDRCTVRVAYAHIARRRARPPHLELVPETPAGDASAEERAIARQAARHLYAELDRLAPKLRVAFVLHVIDGCPLTEVAELMDASLAATKARAWRARRYIDRRASKDPILASYLPRADGRCEEEGE
jgi:RNA polymerase sigma-70 factor (ECF subfamily)